MPAYFSRKDTAFFRNTQEKNVFLGGYKEMNVPKEAKVRKNAMAAYHSTVHQIKKLEYLQRNYNRLNESIVDKKNLSDVELEILIIILKDRRDTLKSLLTSTSHKECIL